jgi:DNA repair protein RadD
MYQLRPYQSRAVARIMDHVRTSTEPCLLDAATGAGKSLIIADVANKLHKISGGKHVLCLAPSAELIEQNHAKYLLTGEPASMFSASTGQRSMRHPVIFGTPGTVKNAISRFGSRFCAVVVDECHGLTPTVRAIIDAMRDHNPNLRVIGLTATPYRLGEGYIYRIGPDDKPCHDGTIRDPYFLKCVDRITPHELIGQGYLTPPTIGAPLADGYDTAILNGKTRFDAADIDAAFVGHGRKTAAIVADVVAQARDRMGVMIFAATVQHAEEVMASLPPSLSAIVTGGTPKAERKSILERFKARKLKYLVNVSVLTTGFDAPHVDLIALFRRTESVGLMQQIIGRGLRLHDDKRDCLVLDYAGNIENHCPDGDVFNPEIRAVPLKQGGGEITCTCPACQTEQVFSARQNPDGFAHDAHGYFVDLAGNRIETEHGPMPAHYGRRCMGGDMVAGKWRQCQYRWSCKTCEACGEENDIAARYCSGCKAELVDPNRYLDIQFRELKKDPYKPQCDEVLKWEVKDTVSQAGKETYRIEIGTPYRAFTVWISKSPNHPQAYHQLELFDALGGDKPKSVKYVKETSGFFRIIGFNLRIDVNEADQAYLKLVS